MNISVFKYLEMKLIGKVDHLLHINNREVTENIDISQDKVNSLNIIDSIQNLEEVEVTKEVKKECLIQELSKLKESSKEAVEGLNTFSKFKTYMHVNRDVQDELKEI